jgi:hypothetical protein
LYICSNSEISDVRLSNVAPGTYSLSAYNGVTGSPVATIANAVAGTYTVELAGGTGKGAQAFLR